MYTDCMYLIWYLTRPKKISVACAFTRYGLRYGFAIPSTVFQRLTCRPLLLSHCKYVLPLV
jgi:hypothetical protein